MQPQIKDFQSPEVIPDAQQESQYQDEWSDRYGILVGGVPRISWDGIGENAIGHQAIVRRVWMPFTRLRVGVRNEFDGALDMPENAVQLDWAKSGERLKVKSPRACAGDVLASFRSQGFCVPVSLIGHSKPQELCEKVWPREVRDNFRLHEHIAYFENFQTGDAAEAKLAGELLEACYLSRDHIQEYVRGLKNEGEQKQGLKNLNEPLKELFHEINEPLPEHKTALVAQAMGQAIVSGQSDGRKDDAIVNALNSIAEGQRTLISRVDRLEQSPISGQGGNTKSEEANASNTQPVRSNGEPDRRFKVNKE